MTKIDMPYIDMDLGSSEFFLEGFPLINMKGGGSSGTIDYPPHMKAFHTQALDNAGVDLITTSMADLVNLANTVNPYAGLIYYDGTTDVLYMENQLALTNALSLSFDKGDWATNYTVTKALQTALDFSALDLTDVDYSTDTTDAETAAFTTILDNDLLSKTYPAFEVGMRDINAVMSSAFVVGKALIVEGRNAQIAKYDADLRHAAFLAKKKSEEVLKIHRNDLELKKQSLKISSDELSFKLNEGQFNWYQRVFDASKVATQLSVDVKKTKIISSREGVEQEAKLAELEGTWEFEAFTYAGNFMASIGGGTSVPKGQGKVGSALSGALSGAGAGAALGPWGAAAGGVLGGLGGLLG